MPEALRDLKAAGFCLVVVTNQPDIARGTQTLANVERLNGEVRRLVGVDDVFVCPHDDGDRCACRKPKPGLLLDAARLHGIDLARSVMVGDRDRDIEAGRAAGCRTVFLVAGYGRAPSPRADHTVARLREALSWIISDAIGTAR